MPKTMIKINESTCKGCYICVSVCPKNVLAPAKNSLNGLGYYAVGLTAQADACIGCQSCALMCPDGAISMYEY
jgi:2-oxoglutarate ferredoxin oxidoreductase subunit delta